MNNQEYLVSHGVAGDFGRFRPVQPLECRRGDRVVVRSQQGLHLGVVLCASTPTHGQLLRDTFVGQLLRRASVEDEQTAERMRERGQHLFEDSRRLLDELGLPLEVLDVEVLLDGQRATLYHLRWGECDERPFVRTLSQRYELMIALLNLALAVESPSNGDSAHGCGKPDCGQGSGGGCSTCGSGGGCATGCGSVPAKELRAFFAGLRQKMDERHLTPLL